MDDQKATEDYFVEEYISVPAGRLMTYRCGSETAKNIIIAINGGPGLPCDYIRDSHAFLGGDEALFVAYDQLGCGKSDRPSNPDLWTIERYAEEIDAVRQHFGAERVHLIGHSWGGWLALEYARAHSPRLASLVLENTCADVPFFILEQGRLRAALETDVLNVLLEHEVQGSFDDPAYQGAYDVFRAKHVLRTEEVPEPMMRSIVGLNSDIFTSMYGPNDTIVTGNLAGWSGLEILPSIELPTLIVSGQHDIITPNCARQMHARLPESQLVIFENSSHSPFFEEPEHFQQTLVSFYSKVLSTAPLERDFHTG